MPDLYKSVIKRLKSRKDHRISYSMDLGNLHIVEHFLHLNNDSLRAIFDYFDVESLCRLVDVCTRLRPFAEKAFNKGHKKMDFDQNTMSESLRRRILCKFGHLITSIRCKFEQFSEVNVNAFTKYCPNLESVVLQYVDIYCDVDGLFAPLKHLELDLCYIFHEKETKRLPEMPNLESLSIRLKHDTDLKFCAHTFPKLVELNLWLGFLHGYQLGQLLSLNPQLQRISIECAVSDRHITAIAQHKNLDVLRITNYGKDMFSPQHIETGLLQLSQLEKLKRFDLISMHKIPENVVVIAPLMAAFSEKRLNLDHLHLECLPIHSDDIKSILNLKTLKILYLGEIKSVSKDDFVSLVIELPLLSDLSIEFKLDDQLISTTTLVNMVNCGKQLNKIELINVQNLKIDEKVFKALIGAASVRASSKKLIINVIGDNDALVINVPRDVQHASRKQLQINHKQNKPNSFNKNYYYYLKYYSNR